MPALPGQRFISRLQERVGDDAPRRTLRSVGAPAAVRMQVDGAWKHGAAPRCTASSAARPARPERSLVFTSRAIGPWAGAWACPAEHPGRLERLVAQRGARACRRRAARRTLNQVPSRCRNTAIRRGATAAAMAAARRLTLRVAVGCPRCRYAAANSLGPPIFRAEQPARSSTASPIISASRRKRGPRASRRLYRVALEQGRRKHSDCR